MVVVFQIPLRGTALHGEAEGRLSTDARGIGAAIDEKRSQLQHKIEACGWGFDFTAARPLTRRVGRRWTGRPRRTRQPRSEIHIIVRVNDGVAGTAWIAR